jgi:hypothetical protein
MTGGGRAPRRTSRQAAMSETPRARASSVRLTRRVGLDFGCESVMRFSVNSWDGVGLGSREGVPREVRLIVAIPDAQIPVSIT